MKNKFILVIVILLILVGCTDNMDIIKNNIKIVQRENTSDNAQNYQCYEITCCNHELILYEDDDISIFAIEGYYLSAWEYSLTLNIKSKLDVNQRLILTDFKINNIEVKNEYQVPIVLLPNEEKTIEYSIDLRFTKALGIDALHVFNVNYTHYLEQSDRWIDKNDVSVYYQLSDTFTFDEYISNLDDPIIVNDDVDVWYLSFDKDNVKRRINLYILVHNKTDNTLMIELGEFFVNGVEQNLFDYSLIRSQNFCMLSLSYEVKYGYKYMNNNDDINALVKVYMTSSQEKLLLYEYPITLRTE